MKFVLLNGKTKSCPVTRYLIDWDKKSRSKFQFNVKQFLKPYWDKRKVVCEEFYVPGTKMSIDIINFTDNLAIECQGIQHQKYSKFFHGDQPENYLSQIKRDFDKIEWCRLNNIKYIEINQGEENSLSEEYFLERHDVCIK